MEDSTAVIIEPSSVTAETINEAHGRVVGLAKGMLGAGNAFVLAAAECGRMLVAKKETFEHGEWLPWLAENCPLISHNTASDYMRVSKIQRAGNLEGVTSIRQALQLLSPKEEGGGSGGDKPLFRLACTITGNPLEWEPAKQDELFERSKPLLEALQKLGRIHIMTAKREA